MGTDGSCQHGEAKERPYSLKDRPTADHQEGDPNNTNALQRNSLVLSLRGGWILLASPRAISDKSQKNNVQFEAEHQR